MTGAVRYRIDDRTIDERRAELARIAAHTVVAAETTETWADRLFTGTDLERPSELSAAWLTAVLDAQPGLADHLNQLPGRALVDWLERRLGIPRLPVVPDEVVAIFTADPARLPLGIKPGTPLRGGKDAFGNDRRYATKEALTVTGATLAEIAAYGRDATSDTAVRAVDFEVPFEPFPAEPAAAARHELLIVTDVIRFSLGEMRVRVDFPGGDPALLAGLDWHYSTATGERSADVNAVGTAADPFVELQLSGGCGPFDLDGESLTYLRASIPPGPGLSPAFGFAATGVDVTVIDRGDVIPDGGFFNQGALDITKEFLPFGPAAKRGDSFYIQSEEALSKPLLSLTLHLEQLSDAPTFALGSIATDGLYPSNANTAVTTFSEDILAMIGGAWPELESSVHDFAAYFVGEDVESSVQWQQYDGARWQPYETTFNELPATVEGNPSAYDGAASVPTEVAGVPGRFVRGFLSAGDFGWVDYQQRIARFAADAATDGVDPNPGDLIPPDPPVLSGVRLSYVTDTVTVTDLRSFNGLATRRLPSSGTIIPFRRPLEVYTGATTAGFVALGLDLPSAALGSALSVYLDVEPAAACATSADAAAPVWEYWSPAADGTELPWRPLDVADGTSGLRQSGVLRFVAPREWPVGSEDVDRDTGHWLRIRTDHPARLSAVRGAYPDAVEAVYDSTAADPASDPTSLTPLVAGELKGLVQSIPGVKKVTNPFAGIVGRGPEEDDAYFARAAHVPRHRNRAVQPWDYEAVVGTLFPEVAVVRCLPHTAPDGSLSPGDVALVVIPHSTDRQPYPSVRLAERIVKALRTRLPVHADVAVVCPIYVPVAADAGITLNPGFTASDAQQSLSAALDELLHPTASGTTQFGRSLFVSWLVSFLESRPEVDRVGDLALLDPHRGLESVPVDPCRGLIASAGGHRLRLVEQL